MRSPLGEALGHRLEDHLDRELGILCDKLRELRRKAVDQLRFGHHAISLYSVALLSIFARRSAPRFVVPDVVPAVSALTFCIASVSPRGPSP
jgi:hypothetical protein